MALHLPGVLSGPTLDAAVFTTIADGLHNGVLPYRDLWDHKPPGVYFLFAAGQAILPMLKPWVAVWLISVAATSGTGLATMALARPLGPFGAAVAGIVTVSCISLYPFSLGGGNTEEPAALVALIAMLVALRPGAVPERSLVSGLLLGVAAVISPQTAATLLGVSAVVVMRERREAWLSVMARLMMGFAAAPAVAVAWVAVEGIAGPASSAILHYNTAYAQLSRDHVDEFLLGSGILVLFGAPLLTLAPIGLLRPRRLLGDPLRLGLAAWVLAGMVAVAIQGRAAPHYVIGFIAPLAILAAGSCWPRPSLQGMGWLVASGLALGVTVACAVIGFRALTVGSQGFDQSGHVTAVARWLRVHAAPEARIFIWGNCPELYLDSGLRPAAKFIYVLPLLTPGYADHTLVAALVERLEQANPQYVIDAGSRTPGGPGIVPLLEPRPIDTRDGRTLDVINPLREFVLDHYGPPIEVAGWLIYERLAVSEVPWRPGEPGSAPLLVSRPVTGDGRALDTIHPIRQVVRDHYGPPVEVDGWLVYERLAGSPGA